MHSSQSDPTQRSNWYQWTLVGLVLGTLCFGAWGEWQYQLAQHPGHLPDRLSVFYHACQLLLAHGAHLEGNVPWQLHLGRFLGTLALFTAGLLTFTRFFRNETLQLRLRLPWRKNHVVICGLGDLGLRLVLDARRRGKFVVVIEKVGARTSIEQARKAGALVIEGDACDATTLRKSRIDRAEFVMAACQDDATNVAVAATIGKMLSGTLQDSPPLVCRLLIRDVELRRLLERESIFSLDCNQLAVSGARYHINFKDLHFHATAARQALRQYPLDFQPILEDSETTVHLVVVGFGPMGQNLALHAARIGHFANEVVKGRKLRITVVERDAQACVNGFRARYPKIDEICEFLLQDADPDPGCLLDQLDELVRDVIAKKELVTIGICFEAEHHAKDRENLRIGLELARRVKNRPVQILIYQSTHRGFAAICEAKAGDPADCRAPLHAFGMIEDIYTWDILLQESEDRVARAIHENYVKHHSKERTAVKWEHLDEHLKDSNRLAADHIPVKLRAIGCRDVLSKEDGMPTKEFTPQEFHVLRQMEHSRWCAERWLNGWEYGPVSMPEKKINKNLAKWEELASDQQQKDHEQIAAIPHVLKTLNDSVKRPAWLPDIIRRAFKH